MKQTKPRFAAILTATIAPKGAPGYGLARTDPQLRLADYETALKFWLTLDAPWLGGIVFAENSGASLDRLKRIADNENAKGIAVDFLSYDYPPTPEGLHYGYSEYLLFRQAVDDSPIALKSTYVIKATGRYRFPNVGRLIEKLPADFKVAIDCKCSNVRAIRKRNYFARFGMAIFDRKYLREHLWTLPEAMVPAPPQTRLQYIENVLYDALIPHLDEDGVVLRWPCNCEAEGIGGNGDNYNTPAKHAKAMFRAVGRIVAPGVWY